MLNQSGNWDDCGAGTLEFVKEMNEIQEVEEEYLRVLALDDFKP